MMDYLDCNYVVSTNPSDAMTVNKTIDEQPEITQLIRDWKQGSDNARDLAVSYLYDELHRTAKHLMQGSSSSMTMNATALVNETFLRLDAASFNTPNRHAFRALAGTAMRRLLMAYLRGQKAQKRGGSLVNVTLYDADAKSENMSADRFIDLYALLDELKIMDERQFRLCEAYYFAGMNYQELAEFEQLSVSTVTRELRSARAWLKAGLLRQQTV